MSIPLELLEHGYFDLEVPKVMRTRINVLLWGSAFQLKVAHDTMQVGTLYSK
jgi:hypothetical protein